MSHKKGTWKHNQHKKSMALIPPYGSGRKTVCLSLLQKYDLKGLGSWSLNSLADFTLEQVLEFN